MNNILKMAINKLLFLTGKRIAIALCGTLVILVFSNKSFAGDKDLGASYGYMMHSYLVQGKKVCNTFTFPIAMTKNIQRKKPSFNVTNRKYNNLKHKIAIDFGIILKPFSTVSLSVDGYNFTLFTHKNYAFPYDGDEDEIFEYMKKGSLFRITGVSQSNRKIYDSYSLVGITNAVREIDKACK